MDIVVPQRGAESVTELVLGAACNGRRPTASDR
jgi:hypothetical protein